MGENEYQIVAEAWQRAKQRLDNGQTNSDGMYIGWPTFFAILKKSYEGWQVRLVIIDRPVYGGNWYRQVVSWRGGDGELLRFNTLTKSPLAESKIFARLPQGVSRGVSNCQ